MIKLCKGFLSAGSLLPFHSYEFELRARLAIATISCIILLNGAGVLSQIFYLHDPIENKNRERASKTIVRADVACLSNVMATARRDR